MDFIVFAFRFAYLWLVGLLWWNVQHLHIRALLWNTINYWKICQSCFCNRGCVVNFCANFVVAALFLVLFRVACNSPSKITMGSNICIKLWSNCFYYRYILNFCVLKSIPCTNINFFDWWHRNKYECHTTQLDFSLRCKRTFRAYDDWPNAKY